MTFNLLSKGRVETSLVELLGADGAGEEYAPLITADVAGTVLGVLPDTVVAVPVSFRNGGELRLQGPKRRGRRISSS